MLNEVGWPASHHFSEQQFQTSKGVNAVLDRHALTIFGVIPQQLTYLAQCLDGSSETDCTEVIQQKLVSTCIVWSDSSEIE